MSDRYDITYEYVCQCLYEENGCLFWKERPLEHFVNQRICKIWNTRFSGKEAGCITRGIRWVVCIDYALYYRHKIIWMIKYGYWPGEIDHKDRNSLNDVIGNLRESTRSQNRANSSIRKDNVSGYKGVSFNKERNKWQAKIRVNYKDIHLGRFDTPELAHEAYMKAAKSYFGEFFSDGN